MCMWVCWCHWRHLIGFIIFLLTQDERALFASCHFSLFLFISSSPSPSWLCRFTCSSTYWYHLLNILLLFFLSHSPVTGKPSPSVIWFIGNEKIDDTYTVDHSTGNTVNEVSISPSLLSQRLLTQFNRLQENYIQERNSHTSSSSESTMNKKLVTNGDDILTLINTLPFLQITCQVFLDAILFPSSPPMSTSLRFDTNCKWAISSVFHSSFLSLSFFFISLLFHSLLSFFSFSLFNLIVCIFFFSFSMQLTNSPSPSNSISLSLLSFILCYFSSQVKLFILCNENRFLSLSPLVSYFFVHNFSVTFILFFLFHSRKNNQWT